MTLSEWLADAGTVLLSPLISERLAAEVIDTARVAGVECVSLPTIGVRTAWSVAPAGCLVVAAQPNRLGVIERIPTTAGALVEPDLDLSPLLEPGGQSSLWIEGRVVSRLPATSVSRPMAGRALVAGRWLARRVRQLAGFAPLAEKATARRCPVLVDHDPMPYLEELSRVDMPAEAVDVAGLPGCLVLGPTWRHGLPDLMAALNVFGGRSASVRAEGNLDWGRFEPAPIVIP